MNLVYVVSSVLLIVGVCWWLFAAGHLDEPARDSSCPSRRVVAEPLPRGSACSYVPPENRPSVEAVPAGGDPPLSFPGRMSRRELQQWAERLAMGGSVKWK